MLFLVKSHTFLKVNKLHIQLRPLMLALRPLSFHISQQSLRARKSLFKIYRFRFSIHQISAGLHQHFALSLKLAGEFVPLPLHQGDLRAETLNLFFLLHLDVLKFLDDLELFCVLLLEHGVDLRYLLVQPFF
jgi:hypothetical protein